MHTCSNSCWCPKTVNVRIVVTICKKDDPNNIQVINFIGEHVYLSWKPWDNDKIVKIERKTLTK